MFETFISNLKGDLFIHLSAPLLQERRSYLEYLHGKGARVQTLQYYAMAMLRFVQISGIQSKRIVSEVEVEKVVDIYMSWNPTVKYSHEKRIAFSNRIKRWLSHNGMMEVPLNNYYGKQFVDAYCNFLSNVKGFSHPTVETRQERLKLFMNYCHENSYQIENMSPIFLDRYLATRMQSLNRRTISTLTSMLRDFFKFCAQKGWCKDNIWQTIKAPRTYKNEDIPAYLPWNHVVSIIKQLSKRNDRRSIRDYAIMLLFAVYGLRDSEVTNLKLSDIDWKNDIIHIRRAKSYRKQALPLIGMVGNAILRYIKEVRPNNFDNDVIFLRMRAPIVPLGNMYTLVRGYLKEEGVDVKHYGAHSLRHSCATFLINHGHSYKLVADILGHQQLDTVSVYAKVDFSHLRMVADMDWEGLL